MAGAWAQRPGPVIMETATATTEGRSRPPKTEEQTDQNNRVPRASPPRLIVTERVPPPKQGSRQAQRLRQTEAAKFFADLEDEGGEVHHPSWDEPDQSTPCPSNMRPAGETDSDEEFRRDGRDIQSFLDRSYAAIGMRTPSLQERLWHQQQIQEAPVPTLADYLPGALPADGQV